MKKYTSEYYNHLSDSHGNDYDEAFLVDGEGNCLLEDHYHKVCRLNFKKLIKAILRARYPLFEAEVLKLAWNFSNNYAAIGNKGAGRRLDSQKVFYVYILLDPRKPGPFSYKLPGGKTIIFPFLPFYVGKGYGKRLRQHVLMAYKNPTSCPGQHKLNTIRKIHRLGMQVIAERITEFCTEAIAFAKENILIKVIGRFVKKDGPLTNLSDGGEGPLGYKFSEQAKLENRLRNKIRWLNLEQEIKDRHIQMLIDNSKQARLKKTQAELDEWIAKIRNSYSSRTEKEKRATLLKRRATLAAKRAVRCPHCGTLSKSCNLPRYHFDKCKYKDFSAIEVCWELYIAPDIKKAQNQIKRINNIRAAIMAKPSEVCPHCNKVGRAPSIYRYHFDKCSKK